MKSFIKAMDGLSLIAKVVLALPFLDLVWVAYRICKSVVSKNNVGIVIGIIMIFFAPFLWLIDIISLVLSGKVIWFK